MALLEGEEPFERDAVSPQHARRPDFDIQVGQRRRPKRILGYLQPDVVHILLDGRIVESGGPDLARALDEGGFDAFRAKVAS